MNKLQAVARLVDAIHCARGYRHEYSDHNAGHVLDTMEVEAERLGDLDAVAVLLGEGTNPLDSRQRAHVMAAFKDWLEAAGLVEPRKLPMMRNRFVGLLNRTHPAEWRFSHPRWKKQAKPAKLPLAAPKQAKSKRVKS